MGLLRPHRGTLRLLLGSSSVAALLIGGGAPAAFAQCATSITGTQPGCTNSATITGINIHSATVTGNKPYQVKLSKDFQPWRLAVQFHPCTRIDARPLVDQLSFVKDPSHWGLPFRRGLFTIPQDDFSLISDRMRPPSKRDFLILIPPPATSIWLISETFRAPRTSGATTRAGRRVSG